MALIGLEVGAPMVFVGSDIQYMKWKKMDQTHVSLRLLFVSLEVHGVVRALGNFSVMALMVVLAASEHLGELNLGGIGSGRRRYA